MERKNCPCWTDEHSNQVFLSSANNVALDAICSARLAIPDKITICNWHRSLFCNSVPMDYYAGNFRKRDKDFPCLAKNVCVGNNLGFHFDSVENSMTELCDWYKEKIANLKNSWDILSLTEICRNLAIIVGTAIGRFIHIHPFLNGNGRTSRLLWASLLNYFNLPPQFSVIRRPGMPYPKIMEAAMQGNYDPAIKHVFYAIVKAPDGVPSKTTNTPSHIE